MLQMMTCWSKLQQFHFSGFLRESATRGTCPTWSCEWHAAGSLVVHFTLICSHRDGQQIHTFISPRIGRARRKCSAVPGDRALQHHEFIFADGQQSIGDFFFFFCLQKERLQLSCCCLAFVNIAPSICRSFIIPSTKDNPSLTSTNTLMSVYLVNLINIFSWFKDASSLNNTRENVIIQDSSRDINAGEQVYFVT